MAESQTNTECKNNENRYEILLKELQSWPEWKIQTLCLDESDLIIRNEILNVEQVHNW